MEDVDTQEIGENDEENMFLSDVIQEDHELLLLDSYLRESFVRHGMGSTFKASGSGVFKEESTI